MSEVERDLPGFSALLRGRVDLRKGGMFTEAFCRSWLW